MKRKRPTTTTTTASSPAGVPLVDYFDGPDGVITNEYAYWNPNAGDAIRSATWALDSGTLYRRGGRGWTGPVDDTVPTRTSDAGSHSAIFRMHTTRKDFGNVRLGFDLDVVRMSSTPSTPPVDWDGVHVMLRRIDAGNCYFVTVNRRDGCVLVKRKKNGVYATLTPETRGMYPIPHGTLQRVEVSIATYSDGSVMISGGVAGAPSVMVVDRDPLLAPGTIGIRGDNVEFYVDNFLAQPMT